MKPDGAAKTSTPCSRSSSTSSRRPCAIEARDSGGIESISMRRPRGAGGGDALGHRCAQQGGPSRRDSRRRDRHDLSMRVPMANLAARMALGARGVMFATLYAARDREMGRLEGLAMAYINAELHPSRRRLLDRGGRPPCTVGSCMLGFTGSRPTIPWPRSAGPAQPLVAAAFLYAAETAIVLATARSGRATTTASPSSDSAPYRRPWRRSSSSGQCHDQVPSLVDAAAPALAEVDGGLPGWRQGTRSRSGTRGNVGHRRWRDPRRAGCGR